VNSACGAFVFANARIGDIKMNCDIIPSSVNDIVDYSEDIEFISKVCALFILFSFVLLFLLFSHLFCSHIWNIAYECSRRQSQ